MREGWEYKKTCWANALTIINGKNQSAVLASDGQYPIYGSGGVMGYANDYLCPENTVIIGRKGSINKPIYVTTKFWNVDTAFGLCAKKDILNPKYWYYFCIDYDFEKHNKAVTILSLTKKDLLKIEIKLPILDNQNSVVAELDQINDLIRLKKEQLKEYDNLAQSIFYDMFGDPVENEKGWEVKKLGELVELKNGLNFTPAEDGNKIRVIGVADFKDNSAITCIDAIGFKTIKEEVSQDYYLKDGDILIVRSNGSKGLVGRNLIVYTNGEMITFSGFSIRCRVKDLSVVSSVYLNAFLSKREIRMLLRQEGRGANISNINQKILNAQRVPLPPFPLQQEFSTRIEQIEKLKTEVQKTITDLEILLASRMQYWFE